MHKSQQTIYEREWQLLQERLAKIKKSQKLNVTPRKNHQATPIQFIISPDGFQCIECKFFHKVHAGGWCGMNKASTKANLFCDKFILPMRGKFVK